MLKMERENRFMKKKMIENIVFLLVGMIISTFISTKDVQAKTYSGFKRLITEDKVLFTVVNELTFPYFHEIKYNINYTENYTYDSNSLKITYGDRSFAMSADLVGDSDINFSITYPYHINSKTNSKYSFVWSKKDCIYAPCDFHEGVKNSTKRTYDYQTSKLMSGEWAILFSCDGALIPLVPVSHKMALSYK